MRYLILTLLLVTGPAFAYGPYSADVIRVIDGDTINIRVAIWPGLEQIINLRLIGVNTPEKRREGPGQDLSRWAGSDRGTD